MPNKCPKCGSFHVEFRHAGWANINEILWQTQIMRCKICGEYYAKKPVNFTEKSRKWRQKIARLDQ